MRARKTSDGLTDQTIGGSHVVLLGWNCPENLCDSLAGFGLHRTDHEVDEVVWLQG